MHFCILLGLIYKTLNRVFNPLEPGFSSAREIKQEMIKKLF